MRFISERFLIRNKDVNDYGFHVGCGCFLFLYQYASSNGSLYYGRETDYNYSNDPPVKGTMIEMTLNMDDLTLSFSIQGISFDKHHIHSAQYRAFLRINNDGCYKFFRN